jgi:ketosteroid isomerase-like protein
MSQQNVAIVRDVYEAFSRREAEVPFASYAPDIEWDITGLGHFGVASVYHGHAGVRACFRDLLSAFGQFELRAEQLQDSGDHVIATVNEQGVGRISGVVVDRRHYALWTLQGGKVVRLRVFLDHGEALGAASLSA